MLAIHNLAPCSVLLIQHYSERHRNERKEERARARHNNQGYQAKEEEKGIQKDLKHLNCFFFF